MLGIQRTSATLRRHVLSRALLPAVAVALGTGSGAFAETNGSFVSRGAGGMECSTLSVLAASEQAATVLQQMSLWVSGYLTHLNRSQPGVFDGAPLPDDSAIARLVFNLCNQNPTANVESVLFAALEKMRPWAVTSQTSLLKFSGSAGETIAIRESALAQLQALLVEKALLAEGYKSGSLDDATRLALEAFQQSKGLPVTGLPDSDTLLVAVFGQ